MKDKDEYYIIHFPDGECITELKSSDTNGQISLWPNIFEELLKYHEKHK